MPCTIPPVSSITGPENFAKIKSPDGPRSRITPNTFTLNDEMVSPLTTVSACPSMPVRTSLTGMKSIASADVVATDQQKRSASTPFKYRRDERNPFIHISFLLLCLMYFTALGSKSALTASFTYPQYTSLDYLPETTATT